jgi:hypothetical protein
VAEARHLRAGVVGLRVVDLAVDVPLHFLRVAAQLAEAEQARSQRAEGRLGRRELVAVVAAAAGGRARAVAPHEAATVLRDRFAALPVAEQAALGEGDRLHLVRLELLRDRRRRPVARLGAEALQAVLRDAVHGRLAARLEVTLQDALYVESARLGDGAERNEGEEERELLHRLVPGPR